MNISLEHAAWRVKALGRLADAIWQWEYVDQNMECETPCSAGAAQ